MKEPIIVTGPVVPSAGNIIYEITLASGMIVTNPGGFRQPTEPASQGPHGAPIVTLDGHVLVLPPTVEPAPDSF